MPTDEAASIGAVQQERVRTGEKSCPDTVIRRLTRAALSVCDTRALSYFRHPDWASAFAGERMRGRGEYLGRFRYNYRARNSW